MGKFLFIIGNFLLYVGLPVIVVYSIIKRKNVKYDEDILMMKYGNNALKEVKVFKSSLIKYMLHRNIFLYVIVAAIIIFSIKLSSNEDDIYLYGFIDIFLTFIILGLSYRPQKIYIAPNEVVYESSHSYDSRLDHKDKTFGHTESYYSSTAKLNRITSIEEKYNSIVIYGKIKKNISMKTESYGSSVPNRSFEEHGEKSCIRIMKDFIDNKGLIEALKQKVNEEEREITSKKEVQIVEVGCIVKLINEESNEEELLEIIDSSDFNAKSSWTQRTSYK